MNTSPDELATIYHQRFDRSLDYRLRVWRVLIADFFQASVVPDAAVLDLGCGYGEFINQIRCGQKYGMDLNPTTATRLAAEVKFLQQDCSAPWPLLENSLDVVFTSNFLEHLPDKARVQAALKHAQHCLKPGGLLIAMGPNIKIVGGAYWDFWDHHVALTELSLAEVLGITGFSVERCTPRFLPYTMARGPQYPLFLLRLYLRLPWLWRFAGGQFLVVARKTLQRT